jgi:hypothetical protein
MTPRRSSLKHSPRASSTISSSRLAELKFSVTRSKQTAGPSTNHEKKSLLFAALAHESLLTIHPSHLLRHPHSNFSVYPLPHFAIVIALLAFLPLGSARQRPRGPWQAGAFPYSQPEERILCAF